MSYQLLSSPSGAMINSNGVITWTPGVSIFLVSKTFTTVVTDGGTPAMSATNSFTVDVSAPASPPTILSLAVNSGMAVVIWSSISGLTYSLEYKDRLSDTNWSLAAPAITASGVTTSGTNSIGGAVQRFYRVNLQQ
jgi:hypothetical protein